MINNIVTPAIVEFQKQGFKIIPLAKNMYQIVFLDKKRYPVKFFQD